MHLQRYSAGSYGSMSPDREGRFVEVNDVAEMLHELLSFEDAKAAISLYLDVPEVSDDRPEDGL